MNRDVKSYVHNKEDKEKLNQLMNNPFDVKKWIKFYNAMCKKCRANHTKLMQRGRSITEDKLCDDCKDKMYKVVGGGRK